MQSPKLEKEITAAIENSQALLKEKKVRDAYLALKPAFEAIKAAGGTDVPETLQAAYGRVMELENSLEKEKSS